MICVQDVELRAGPRLLLTGATFRVGPGDRVGLVGRNGAGKTTLARVLAGELTPAAGSVTSSEPVGYLPQDPAAGDVSTTAADRVLSARGLDTLLGQIRAAENAMGGADPAEQRAAVRRYGTLQDRWTLAGGYPAQAEAAAIAAGLGLPERVLGQPLGTLSGGQRRRVELARVLFSGAATLLLDEPTNHLDADSLQWLRGFLRGYTGGLLFITHDTGLLSAVANRVFHLDPDRAALDVHNLGWAGYLRQRDSDERRRQRERATALRQAAALRAQADRMRAKATKARAAHGMDRRADRLLTGLAPARRTGRVAALRFPRPAACGRTPLSARGLGRCYGSLRVFSGVDLSIDRGSRVVVLGLNGAGKTTLLRLLAGVDRPDGGLISRGPGLRVGYYAQEHETLDPAADVLGSMLAAAPDQPEPALRRVLGSFLFSGDTVRQPVRTLSGGERTRLALATLVVSGANVLLLDEPTNNLDPASRAEVLGAIRGYSGAIVLVTHDEGAVAALAPQRVLLLPDGVEDYWNDGYRDLVALA